LTYSCNDAIRTGIVVTRQQSRRLRSSCH